MIKQFLLHSNILNMDRKIRVFIPRGSKGPYSVLYMHDGQNLFDKSDSSYNYSWDIDKKIIEMLDAKLIKNIMVVAIDNTEDRLNEYSFTDNKMILDTLKIEGSSNPKGILYSKFIVDELKPYIDKEYNTLSDFDNTLLLGSSMGACISLYMALTYSNIFSKIGLFSLASWYNQDAYNTLVNSSIINKNQKFFIAVGGNENNDENSELSLAYIKTNKDIHSLITKNGGVASFNLYPNAIHHESFWGVIFPYFLLYSFN